MTSSADEQGKSLSTPEFWNERYDTRTDDNPTHEWFRSYESLSSFFQTHLPSAASNPKILHLGSGDSTIPYDLARNRGYRDQVCVDFSQVVVDFMQRKNKSSNDDNNVVGGGDGTVWKWADVRNLRDTVADGSIDVAFDKGTMDAMIHGSPWDPPEDVWDNTGAYVREVHRILKKKEEEGGGGGGSGGGGVFLYVTYRQPHFIRPLLLGRGVEWEVEMEVLGEGGSSFEYFGWVLRRK
ncbi:EEF1A lysine methyltransferase 4 [Lecanosticta acicola]|uniref:EEF1A lysine methyltransferase 4 n=1 Tax=Lecanosticta acicola TaxID=111012 RepID=A0AAI8YYW4_9PEZI|nr:EEF1A lysine methyltransferase 4 [Lecanosticta acicola]